jgi:hypothetical protein
VFTGTTMERLIDRLNPAQRSRLEALLQRTIESGACRVWPLRLNAAGYGRYKIGPVVAYAHRAAWELTNGPIPQGLTIDHLCRNRGCVNLAHLEVVTHAENIRRANTIPPGGTCKRGHLMDDNPYRYKHRRFCRKCRRLREQKALATANS